MSKVAIFRKVFFKKFGRECPHEYAEIWKDIQEDYHFEVAMEEFHRTPPEILPYQPPFDKYKALALESAVNTFEGIAVHNVDQVVERAQKLYDWLKKGEV